MSTLNRLIDKSNRYFYHARKSVSVFSRSLALVVFAAMLTSIFPTLADETTPIPTDVVNEEVPQPEDSNSSSNEESSQEVTASPEPSITSSSLEEESSQQAEEEQTAEEEEVEEEEIEIAEVQPQILFRFPSSVAHDPRASRVFLPELGIFGGGVGMFCIYYSGIVDVATKNISNNSQDGNILVSGDLTSNPRISGDFYSLVHIINSGGGIRIISNSGSLSRASLVISYVELTGLDNKPEFCAGSRNSRSIAFRPLGLQMDTIKSKVDFNKPSGR